MSNPDARMPRRSTKRLSLILAGAQSCIVCLALAAGQASAQKAQNVVPPDSPEEHFQSAQTFQLAGDYEKAAAEYRESIARCLEQLGNLRAGHDDYAASADLLRRAVQVAPTLTAARVDLGVTRLKAGDLNGAQTEAEVALKQAPQNSRAMSLAGKIYFLQGNYQAAADSLQSALQLENSFDIGYTLALADLELKKPTPAGIIFDDMLAASKPSASLQALIGIAYRETGYLDEAISHLNKAIALDPNDPRPHAALGETYFLQGAQGYARAREQFLSELKISPEDYTSLYYLGMIAAKEKNVPEALKWLDQAASVHPDDPDVYFQYAQIQFEAGDYKLAEASLRKSLALANKDQSSPGPALVHELLGDTLKKLGRKDEAAAELSQAQQIRSRQTHSETVQQGVPQPLQRFESSQQELRSMLVPGPQPMMVPRSGEEESVKRISALLGEGYDNLGVIDAKAERYATAAAEFAEAARWGPNIQNLDRNWGMAAFRASQYDEAIAPLERELRRAPHDLVLTEALGVSYYMRDDFDRAADVFRPVQEKLPNNPGVLYAAGVSLARTRHSNDAGKIFSRMLKENPNVPEIHLLLGEAYSDEKEFPEALAELSNALKLDPKLSEAHYYKGIVHFKQGQMDSAAEEFQAELNLHASFSPAQYQLAVIRLQQHQLETAVGLLNQVVEREPSNPDAHYQLGKALLEQGDVKAAVENLETAVHLQPRDYSYYQLSLAYRRDGRLQDAEIAQEKYENLKKRPSSSPTPGQ
jgi:tetratricopeptide (TPR) repeat protein